MLSVDAALALIVQHRLQGAIEERPLAEALQRTLARNVHAKVTVPPVDVSAMDGYAVRFEDAQALGAQLRVIGAAPAGAPFRGAIGAGQAVRIFTGGAVPPGADHILIQEDAEAEGDSICVTAAQRARSHIRKAGIDFHEGDLLLPAGTKIGPAALGVAAAGDHASLRVHRAQRVAFLANGDELRAPGSPPRLGSVVSSNAATLGALVRQWGHDAIDLGIAPDSPDAIQALAAEARDADLIVPIGGASVGDHDHMKATFLALSFDLIFSKIAVRPGKPTWFAMKGSQRVLGLPGNPASAYVCAQLFLKPLLGEADGLVLEPARLAGDLDANGPRETFVRGKLHARENGLFVAPLNRQDSALMTPFLEADALIRRMPGQPAAKAGEPASILRI